MPKSTPPVRPTGAELAILQVLWWHGPSTVRHVASVLERTGEYTTILKTMQVMAGKHLVIRDERARSHVYTAAFSQEQIQELLVTDLLDRAFDGSAATLMMRALSARRTSRRELEEIARLVKAQGRK